MELKEIQEIIKAKNITTLRLEYPDLYGISRGKMMPAKHLEAVAEEGLGFAQAIYGIHLGNDVAAGTGDTATVRVPPPPPRRHPRSRSAPRGPHDRAPGRARRLGRPACAR